MPEYNKGDKYAPRAKNVSFLLPAEYISGVKRSKFFSECPPNKLVVIPERIDFLEQGSSPQSNHVWFVWEEWGLLNTSIYWATEDVTGIKVERVKRKKTK